MPDQHVGLLEGSLVEEEVEALAGGQLALLVLPVDGPLAPRMQGFLA